MSQRPPRTPRPHSWKGTFGADPLTIQCPGCEQTFVDVVEEGVKTSAAEAFDTHYWEPKTTDCRRVVADRLEAIRQASLRPRKLRK